jgi:diamine N-acetyltransferase
MDSSIRIEKTYQYKALELLPEQTAFVCSEPVIQHALTQSNCIGFYAYEGQTRFGFALLREFEASKFFLWDFIIDKNHQRKGYGKKFLMMLLVLLHNDYSARMITTTYIYGNQAAKKLYEGTGFVETDVVDEDSVHEVNMVYANSPLS